MKFIVDWRTQSQKLMQNVCMLALATWVINYCSRVLEIFSSTRIAFVYLRYQVLPFHFNIVLRLISLSIRRTNESKVVLGTMMLI